MGKVGEGKAEKEGGKVRKGRKKEKKVVRKRNVKEGVKEE
jgi:hypothetical protein